MHDTGPDAPAEPPLTYRDAGVDIDRGSRLVEAIKALAGATPVRAGLLSGIGGFGALFEVPVDRYRRPVLVSGTDGVGTKLRLAIDSGRHDTVGIDLVAMCVNDVLTHGAEPLFFLDYFATGRLDLEVAERVVGGIARGCSLAGASLVGGETAEMPGMYADGDYDLAGFCVGVVERDAIVDGSAVSAGDALVGLASSGPHSNGYSLIRKVIAERGVGLDRELGDGTLLDSLLEPTRIYVGSVLPLMRAGTVRAAAHITGGGIAENLPRVLPDGLGADVDTRTWRRPQVFNWIQIAGRIRDAEMLKTFNCGVGMILVLADGDADAAIGALREAGETAFRMGRVVPAAHGPRVRFA